MAEESKPNSNLIKIKEAGCLFYEKDNPIDAEKLCANLAKKKKDSDTKFQAKALLSSIYRSEGKIEKATGMVSDCGDFDKISSNSLYGFKSSYLVAFLELAHCKAIDNNKQLDVREAFKMLDYAERNTEGIDKALALFKYGDVLFSIREFSKSQTYLKNSLDYGNKYFKVEKAEYSSEEPKKIPGSEKWTELKKRIEKLLSLVEIALIEEEYGEGYALYVKARMFYDKKSYECAIIACHDLITKHHGTVYEQAIRLTYADCLLETGKEKDAKKVLEDLVKDFQNSPYFGEAIMKLSRIYLENDWDSDNASKYYKQALDWFSAERERKDAIDLYTLPEKVVGISAPQDTLSKIDKWYRTVYRKPTPKEIINNRTASWYVNENEMECMFMVGFFLFIDEKFEEARDCFVKVGSVNKDLAFLEQKSFPNAIMRLRGACKQGFLIARPEEMKPMKGANKLKATIGDLKYVLEKFDEGYPIFESILKDPKASDAEKAYALVGMGNCLIMKSPEDVARAKQIYKNAFETYPKTVAAAHAMLSYAYQMSYSTDTKADSFDLFLNCHQKYPDTFFGEEALARLIANSSFKKNKSDTEKYVALYEKKYQNGHFNKFVAEYLKKIKEE